MNAEIKTNFALQKILVSDGGYRIPQQNVKYLDGNIDPVYTTDTAATGKGNGVTGVLTPLFNSPSTTTASGFNWLKWGIIAVILYFVYKNIK